MYSQNMLIEKIAIIVLLYDLVTNWYRHMKLSFIKHGKPIEKHENSLDNRNDDNKSKHFGNSWSILSPM